MKLIDITGSYRGAWTTGAVTTIAAGTATAGHLFALRSGTAGKAARLRKLEVEFILTTAFGAAQEVGFDAYVARGYSEAHTGATAITIATNDCKLITDDPTALLAGRIADTGALTAGTHTLDAHPIARGSAWMSAVGAQLQPRQYDFSDHPYGGIILQNNEGVVVRNTILMGASGVGKWHFSAVWDQVLVA